MVVVMGKEKGLKRKGAFDDLFEAALKSLEISHDSLEHGNPVAKGDAGNLFRGIAGKDLKPLKITPRGH
jgi:hypothetical protein